VIDFEVLKTQVLEGGNGFQINLAIFTSYYQYLVYETQTSLLANLKTLSQTKLLYHVFTPDSTISLLGSIHIARDQRTVVAMMSEIDPLK